MDTPQGPPAHDAVLLAGGRASRLGGVDKTALRSGGRALLDHATAAAADARRLVVVGVRDGHELPAGAVVTREDPPYAGPAAAIGAGLAAITDPSPWVLVLACDLVRPREATARLLAATGAPDRTDGTDVATTEATAGADGFVAVDDDGRRQPLLALYRSVALREAVAAAGNTETGLTGLSLRRLLAPLDLVEVPVPSDLCADVDTPDAAAGLR